MGENRDSHDESRAACGNKDAALQAARAAQRLTLRALSIFEADKEDIMKKTIALLMALMLTTAAAVGCGSGQTTAPAADTGATAQAQTGETTEAGQEGQTGQEETQIGAPIADGMYQADFNTDSSMFHVNETKDGKGVLIVSGGKMTIHVVMPSKNILNLYCGTAEDAQKEGAVLLQPMTEEVTYSDGTREEVNTFDIPVPYLDKEFDVALIGEKGKWYDHKVSVSNPVSLDELITADSPEEAAAGKTAADGGQTEAAPDAGADKESASEEDLKAAQAVAEKIDAIYVQQWTEETDQMCAEAKEAWDALTDEQKALVEGEFADPDYFGLDTGDASEDDPLNGNEIGEKELLVVSFGTSFNGSRAADIGGIEKALQEAYPDWSVRRAFTAQIIINHVLARDGEKIDNVEQALERAAANGVKQLVIQPTHLMHGAEYDKLAKAVEDFSGMFESVKIAEPLLGEVGADAAEINADKEAVAKAITEAAVAEAGFDSIDAAEQDKTAFVFLGHGTSHMAKVTYDQMQTQMDQLGYGNVFIGTVEGEPEDTACEAVIEKVKAAGYTKVVLRPLMVVAGDHAHNDMAGEEEDSWLSMFSAAGFEKVDTQIAGMGSVPAVQQIYVEHAGAVTGE